MAALPPDYLLADRVRACESPYRALERISVARKRHHDKHVEEVLRAAEAHGWRVDVPRGGYWKLMPVWSAPALGAPYAVGSELCEEHAEVDTPTELLEGAEVTKVLVEFRASVDMSHLTSDDLERILDGVMKSLQDIGAPDPAVASDLSNGEIEIELTFPTEDMHAALETAVPLLLDAVRSSRLAFRQRLMSMVRDPAAGTVTRRGQAV